MIKLLPKELIGYIFTFLSSENRSKVCSVSKLFEELSISISKKLSVTPFLYINRNFELSNEDIKKISIQGDYHLVVRLKSRKLINLEWACLGGHKQIVELTIQKGADNWDYGLNGACLGVIFQLLN